MVCIRRECIGVFEFVERKKRKNNNNVTSVPVRSGSADHVGLNENNNVTALLRLATDAALSSPATTTNNSTIEAWQSPYLVDCREMILSTLEQQQHVEDGTFKQTLTNPSFLMNLYDPTKEGISKIIYNEGCWECNHLKDMLTALSLYPDSYFLDIGGNIGMWSLTAAAANHDAFTIEALPANCQRFCKSVAKNDFYNRTRLMNVAATSEPDTFRMNVPPDNAGGTRVYSVGNNTPIIKGVNIEADDLIVKGVPIDSLNLPLNRPVVMKIDVEGHELQALYGAINFLKEANVVYAMMELRTNLHSDKRWKEIFDVLSSKGLKPIRLNYEDETELDEERLSEWKHFKHPIVKYYDVAWRLDDFVSGAK